MAILSSTNSNAKSRVAAVEEVEGVVVGEDAGEVVEDVEEKTIASASQMSTRPMASLKAITMRFWAWMKQREKISGPLTRESFQTASALRVPKGESSSLQDFVSKLTRIPLDTPLQYRNSWSIDTSPKSHELRIAMVLLLKSPSQ